MTSPSAGHSDSTSSEPSAQAIGPSASVQTAAGPGTTAFRQLRLALALLLAIIALATIWLPAWVPGTDMPTHLMMAELLAHPDRATDLVVRHYPATSQLSVWLTVPFALFFPLAVAGKAALTLFYATYVAANARLGARFGAWFPDTLTWSSAMFFGFCYAMGFTNFLVAAASGAMFLAAVYDHVHGRGRRTGLFILFWSLLCMHAHIIVFGMFGLQALVLVLLLPHPSTSGVVATTPTGHFRAVAQLALYSMPALAATLVILLGIRQPLAAGFDDQMLHGVRLPISQQLVGLMEFGFGGWTNAGWVSFAAWVVVMAACLWLAKPAMRRLAVATLLVWTAVYFIVPFHLAGWAFAQPRALLLLFPLPMLFVVHHVRASVAVASAGAVALAMALAIPPQLDAGRHIAAQVAEFPAQAPGVMMVVRTPMASVAASSWVEPFHHVASYRAGQGGIMPHMMRFNPWMHSVTVNPDMKVDWSLAPAEFVGRSLDCEQFSDCRRNALLLADRVSLQHEGFDSLLVIPEHPVLGERLMERGQLQENPGHFRLQPGRGVVRLVRESGQVSEPLTIRLSWPDTLGLLGEITWPAESLSIDVGPIPAGPVQFSVVSTVDARPLFDAMTQLPNSLLRVSITELVTPE
jgi:hypothetical protein